ncbi:MAG: glycyl-radical enzyme activating protein [Chitinispirillaceae bacterium]|nr:glycyl-radical enzyme activating protein [Chitinispirillaceae bacterium]
MSRELRAPVTRIIRGSTVDGPGIRTVVFLKGCPLRCGWCHNPETQSPEPELLFDHDRCIGCRACTGVCDFNAIDFSRDYIVNRNNCTACFACTVVCPSNALTPAGRSMTAEDLADECVKDTAYFSISGGGITFSGGEPLLYPDFVRKVAELSGERGIPTCIDTSLAVPVAAILTVLPCTDLFLVDIKHAQRVEVQPETVFSNLSVITGKTRIRIRIPVVPEWNDTTEDLQAIIDRLVPLRDAIEQVDLLPFHTTATVKYRSLDRSWERYGELPPLPTDRIEKYAALLTKQGFKVG